MDAWYLIPIASLVLLLTAVTIIIVLVLRDSPDDTNTAASDSCCAAAYQDASGNEISTCAFQPFRDRPSPGGSDASVLLSANSFSQACRSAGGSTVLTDAGGVRCACTCSGASRDLSSVVAADGRYYESIPLDAPSITTNCPGYRS